MIDVRKRKESMKRSINGCCNTTLAECRQRVVANHFVFVFFAAIPPLELFESIQVKQREARFRD